MARRNKQPNKITKEEKNLPKKKISFPTYMKKRENENQLKDCRKKKRKSQKIKSRNKYPAVKQAAEKVYRKPNVTKTQEEKKCK